MPTRNQSIKSLVKSGLSYKSAAKLVDNYSDDPIVFAIKYNAMLNKAKGTNISLADNNMFPMFSVDLAKNTNNVNRGAW